MDYEMNNMLSRNKKVEGSADQANVSIGYRRKQITVVSKDAADVNNSNTDPEETKQRIFGKARPSFVVRLVDKKDELTEEDLEIIQQMSCHVEEEQKMAVEQEEAESLLYTFSRCSIPGCIVHTLFPTVVHYGSVNSMFIGDDYADIGSMDKRLKQGYQKWEEYEYKCSYVEVYDRHIVIVYNDGTTSVVKE